VLTAAVIVMKTTKKILYAAISYLIYFENVNFQARYKVSMDLTLINFQIPLYLVVKCLKSHCGK
jgi:hypothetical protein